MKMKIEIPKFSLHCSYVRGWCVRVCMVLKLSALHGGGGLYSENGKRIKRKREDEKNAVV